MLPVPCPSFRTEMSAWVRPVVPTTESGNNTAPLAGSGVSMISNAELVGSLANAESVTDAGVLSLSVSDTVAVRGPCAVGEKAIPTLQTCPMVSEKEGRPQVSCCREKSPALGPVIEMLVAFKVAPPVLVMLIEVLVVLPTLIGMKFGLVNTAYGPVDTVPENVTVWGELGALVATLTDAVRVPVALAEGLNATESWQKC